MLLLLRAILCWAAYGSVLVRGMVLSYHLLVAIPGGAVQGRVGEDGGAGGSHGVRPQEVRVCPYQHLHCVEATVLRRQIQRRFRLQVGHGGVPASGQQ